MHSYQCTTENSEHSCGKLSKKNRKRSQQPGVGKEQRLQAIYSIKCDMAKPEYSLAKLEQQAQEEEAKRTFNRDIEDFDCSHEIHRL